MPFEEIKKLAPKERIKKLKDLEASRKNELKEAEELIIKTEKEIEHQKNVPDVEVPSIEPVDISKIFESEEGIEGIADEAKTEEDSDENVKYSSSSNYTSYDIEVTGKVVAKGKSKTKYESTVDQLDDLTASKSAHKTIKKYSSQD